MSNTVPETGCMSISPGDRLEIVDEATAEVRKVEVFVAILPCSHYTYCEAVWSQKRRI